VYALSTLLNSSITSEPRWLRSKFFKLRDPNFSEVGGWVSTPYHTMIMPQKGCLTTLLL
jgi:hypothetical protein